MLEAAKPYETHVVGLVDPATAGHLELFQSKIYYSVRDTIDTVDYATSPAVMPVILRSVHGVACATRPADLDPLTPGDQLDCAFTMVVDGVEAGSLAGCTTGVLPCWDFIPDPINCFDGSARFVTRGFPGSSHPGIRGQCVVN
jgi:hypothetical protein